MKVTHDRIDKDRDRRIQEALALVFRGSVAHCSRRTAAERSRRCNA